MRPLTAGNDWTSSMTKRHALNRSGILSLRVPPAMLTPDMATKRGAELRIGLRHRTNPVLPRIRRIGINVLPIEQRAIVAAAVLGTGNAAPDQSFPMRLAGLDPQQPPVVEVQEGIALVRWERTHSLRTAGPDDRVYYLDVAAGRIVFGNGVNGRIPQDGAQVRHLDYVVTRGTAGNLAANLDWQVRGAALNTGAVRFGTNPLPLTGGADASSTDELRIAARRRALQRSALTTNDDIRGTIGHLRSIGVHATDVLVGFDPSRPEASVPNSRTLLVTPGAALAVSPARIPVRRRLGRAAPARHRRTPARCHEGDDDDRYCHNDSACRRHRSGADPECRERCVAASAVAAAARRRRDALATGATRHARRNRNADRRGRWRGQCAELSVRNGCRRGRRGSRSPACRYRCGSRNAVARPPVSMRRPVANDERASTSAVSIRERGAVGVPGSAQLGASGRRTVGAGTVGRGGTARYPGGRTRTVSSPSMLRVR